jgi:hypothetical protein
MIKKRNKKEGGERLRKCNVSGVNLIEVHYMHMSIKMKHFVHFMLLKF